MLPMCRMCGNPPDLQGIGERLQELTTPSNDLTEVRMTFAPHGRRSRVTLHTVVRGTVIQLTRVRPTLDEALESKKDEVERLIRGVSGCVSYTLLRTSNGGVSVTVCQDKAGADESVRVAADWVRQNAPVATSPPLISEGNTILHFNK